jgi:hypothetical protein
LREITPREHNFQFIEENSAKIESFRGGIERWQEILDAWRFSIFAFEACIRQICRLLLAKEVGDAVARDTEKASR